MKTLKVMIIGGLLAGIVAAQAFALETSMEPAPQTLADFQRAYSGTKPSVAFDKYGASKFLNEYPQTTLDVSRIRDYEPAEMGQGTKPTVLPTRGAYSSLYVPAYRTGTKPSLG